MVMDVKKWVEIFEAAGIGEAGQRRWHHEFEQRAPEGHQAFLVWLGLPAGEVERVRAASRT